ncbi:hypothetical protein [Microbacterium sp. Marseille-Q6648]|uniref:hypothetical protein n=1 Tax=Microbacterium sp. Marseille-Q6648 TaxID=2937991 RepID=UPI00203F7449|nr:hypothetical protein [Microbacterium sp. Marseille-Q6648]
MPKQLINLIGIVVCAGILGLAVAVVALPIYFQSLATGTQTAEVDQTNDVYQIQVEGLRAQEERMGEIEASVSELRTQMPAANEFDDVFELVARSASDANVQVQTITAGENAAFAVRTAPLAIGEEPEAPAPAEQTADPAAGEATDPAEPAAPEPLPAPVEGAPLEGRQQVDFTITVTATQLQDAIGFLDRLRTGPRLLTAIDTTVVPTGTGYDVLVSALTYVLPEN